ncbi:MAG: hypothetical protein ABII76_08740 [Pseudomonadota bacterium]
MSKTLQIRNAARPDLIRGDVFGNGVQYLHEPVGDVGVWNGQFETGPGSGSPPGWPEGWELAGDVARVATDHYAGDYSMKGRNTAETQSLRYIPINEGDRHYVAGAFKGETANTELRFGVECYDTAKVSLGNVWVLNGIAPGVNWVIYRRRIGTDADGGAWIANTAYARLVVQFSTNVTYAGEYIYADDLQLQQEQIVRCFVQAAEPSPTWAGMMWVDLA